MRYLASTDAALADEHRKFEHIQPENDFKRRKAYQMGLYMCLMGTTATFALLYLFGVLEMPEV